MLRSREEIGYSQPTCARCEPDRLQLSPKRTWEERGIRGVPDSNLEVSNDERPWANPP